LYINAWISSKKLLSKLEYIDLTKVEGFSALISDLFTDCDVFEPDSALREDYEMSGKELKNCVKKNFFTNNKIFEWISAQAKIRPILFGKVKKI
jgi:hypothetical protein